MDKIKIKISNEMIIIIIGNTLILQYWKGRKKKRGKGFFFHQLGKSQPVGEKSVKTRGKLV